MEEEADDQEVGSATPVSAGVPTPGSAPSTGESLFGGRAAIAADIAMEEGYKSEEEAERERLRIRGRQRRFVADLESVGGSSARQAGCGKF